MTVTVLVEQTNGEFSASLVGSPGFLVIRPTRAEAISALRHELAAKVAAGDLVDLELQPQGVSSLAGMFRDDPSLGDICEDIYRQRDAERPQ